MPGIVCGVTMARMHFFKDLSLSAFTAGFVAVLVGFTSSVAIVFQAAQAFHATPEMIASWMWALGIGMGLCTLIPSLWLKKPVMVAWSTPGVAVLASAGAVGNFSMHEAIGAFMVCAALITLAGWTGWFARVMNRIPLVLTMLLTYLVEKRWLPRYAVPLTLLVAIIFVAAGAGFTGAGIDFGLAMPVFVRPHFTWAALVSLALAPFGAFALNLSAITAAICMGPEAHANPARRYTAAVSCGILYLVIGLFGVAITGVLTAFPKELVAAIAGLALLGTIGGALTAALHREAALITFLVTLSGVVVAGVGSAFWGVVAGAVALAFFNIYFGWIPWTFFLLLTPSHRSRFTRTPPLP